MNQKVLKFALLSFSTLISLGIYQQNAQAASFQGLGDLPGGVFDSSANGVSADGSVIVGGSYSANGYEAFRWTQAGGMQGLGDLSGGDFSSNANGVSADGSVVVGSGSATGVYGTEAFRWTEVGGFQRLGTLHGEPFSSYASSVSADGSVVVGGDSPYFLNVKAFRWTKEGGMQGLGVLGSYNDSVAYGVSADGSFIVGASGYFARYGIYEAFIWDADNGIRNLQEVLVDDFGLNLTGWELEEATGISADGLTIVGTGINPNGTHEAWIANLSQDSPTTTPEPNSLLALGFVSLLGLIWKGKRN